MWEDIYPILLIIVGVLVGLFVLLLLILTICHNKMFASRYTVDPDVTYYKKEEFNMNMDPVEFKVDNDTLRGGVYYHDFEEYKGLIVFCHGMFSSIHSYMQDIAYLSSKGYKILAINYTGIDSSDGKNYRGFGQSLKCIDYAVRYAKENAQLKNYDISVVGHSWGGFAALNIQKYHNDIKKAVAIAPFVSTRLLLKSYIPKIFYFVLPAFVLIDSMKCGGYSFANAIKVLKNKENVMIVKSKNDHMVKYELNAKKLLDSNNKIASIINDNRLHNPHYTQESVNLLAEYSKKLNELSSEERKELKRNTDFHKLGELDQEVMDKIVAFIG